MTSASSSSAKSLFVESKQRLMNRVQANLNYIASLNRQIVRGSKSDELLMKSVKDFVSTENSISNSEELLKKMELIGVHLGYQYENMHQSALMLFDINDQLEHMLKSS